MYLKSTKVSQITPKLHTRGLSGPNSKLPGNHHVMHKGNLIMRMTDDDIAKNEDNGAKNHD